MMGTSLLAMPWAMKLSGLVAGPTVAIGLALIAVYTCITILRINNCKKLFLFSQTRKTGGGRIFGFQNIFIFALGT